MAPRFTPENAPRPRYYAQCLGIFLFALAYFSAHLAAFWPGLITIDGYNYIYDIVISGDPVQDFDFESQLYGALVFFLAKFDVRLLYVTALQILVAAGTVAYGYYVIARRLGRPGAALLGVAFLFLPVNAWMVITSERDVLFAWLGLLLLLQLMHLSLLGPKAGHSAVRMALLSLTAVALAGLRYEGVMLAALVPWQLYVLGKPDARAWKALVVSFALWALVAGVFWASLASRRAPDRVADDYLVRNISYPVVYILQRRSAPVTAEEGAVLSPFFGPHHLLDWVPGQTIRLKYGQTAGQRDAYLRLSLRLLKDNFGEFLSFKGAMMARSFSDALVSPMRWQDEGQLGSIAPALAIAPPEDSLWPWARNASLEINRVLLSKPFVFASGPAFGAFVLLSALLWWTRAKRAAALALGPLLHLLVVALAQPIGKPRFLYLTFLFPAFFLPYLWASLSEKKGAGNTPPPVES